MRDHADGRHRLTSSVYRDKARGDAAEKECRQDEGPCYQEESDRPDVTPCHVRPRVTPSRRQSSPRATASTATRHYEQSKLTWLANSAMRHQIQHKPRQSGCHLPHDSPRLTTMHRGCQELTHAINIQQDPSLNHAATCAGGILKQAARAAAGHQRQLPSRFKLFHLENG